MESSRVDPRTHITPDAFKVTPELLGTPLASPGRRAAALLVDLALAAILAELGGFLIGLAAAFVFFRVATRRADDEPIQRWMRASLALVGAFFLFITALVIIESGGDDDDDDDELAVVTATDWSSIDWTAMSDTAEVEEFVEALTATAMATLNDEDAENDSLGPEERAEAAALLRTYARALNDDDRPTLDSLEDRAAALVAARPLRLLRAQNKQHRQHIDALEDENERLVEEAANPGIRRILKTAANDFGLTFGWIGLYFTLFLPWWHGLTPGKRLLGIQVVRLNGEPITLWIAFERLGGYAAGIATGLLGFFQIFWDPNRQGIHDRIAGTAVIRRTKK